MRGSFYERSPAVAGPGALYFVKIATTPVEVSKMIDGTGIPISTYNASCASTIVSRGIVAYRYR